MSGIYRDKLHKRRWLWVWAVAFACLIIFSRLSLKLGQRLGDALLQRGP